MKTKTRKKMKTSTIVKNGKRLPARLAGRAGPARTTKKGPPPRYTSKTTTHPVTIGGVKVPMTETKLTRQAAAEARKEAEKLAKAKQRKAIEAKVGKLTEMSKTTADAALAYVTTWDESDAKASELKEQIAGMKGSNQKDKDEIRRLARESKAKDVDLADTGKRLSGLELDVQRREVKLAGLTEERTGHRETMKATMHELRKLIRDKALGGLLFEKNAEVDKGTGEVTTKGKAPAAAPATTGAAATASTPTPSPASTTSSTTDAGSVPPMTFPKGVSTDRLAIDPTVAGQGIPAKLAKTMKEAGIKTLGEARALLLGVRAGTKQLPEGISTEQATVIEKEIERRLAM